MADNQPPLDEIVWNDPASIQEMGSIHTNTILPYFSRSTFYDPTSNNAALTIQAFHQPSMYHLLQTRTAFEGRLREMQGLEYMVSHDPSEGGTKVLEEGAVWVIRKQVRRKRGGGEDEVEGLSSYFVVGGNVFMAPSVGGIVGGRMLSTVTCLTKLLHTASTLPTFTPATGNTYRSPSKPNITPNSSFPLTNPSKEGTPLPGSSTPLPATQDTTSSTSKSASKVSEIPDYASLHMLGESYNLSLRYGHEYMDENPIVGEPGAFRLTRSQDSAGMGSSMSTSMASQSQSVMTESAVKEVEVPTPQPQSQSQELKMEDASATSVVGKKATKGVETGAKEKEKEKEKKEKKERRKSKGVVGMGVGPMAAETPTATTPKIGTPV